MSTELEVFFFQAEDGIRVRYVTGVQTCALPTSDHPTRLGHRPVGQARHQRRDGLGGRCRRRGRAPAVPLAAGLRARLREIGRASCRERVEITADVAQLKKINKEEGAE